MKKILIVGGVAGGATAAARLRRYNEDDQIIIFEKGPHLSFSNCSLPYYLSGMVEELNSVVLSSPEKFMSQYKIDARINSEVMSIDRIKKEISVKDYISGKIYTETYDKLILSPGANPIVPNFEGLDKINYFTVRNVVDIENLNNFVHSNPVKNITIIGGGFIGIEVAENLQKSGFNITIIEAANQIMKPFDYDIVQILHKELLDHNIHLILGDKVSGFQKNIVLLESGNKITTDVVVMAIGISPNTELAKKAEIEIGKTGAIKVDQNYMTNDRDIYAIGDAIEVFGSVFKGYFKLSLAGPAHKQAIAVADHINGSCINNQGFIGSSVIRVFGYNGASTGINEGFIKATGMDINYGVVHQISNDSSGLMPNSNQIHFKLLYEIPTGRVLGAQAIGKGNIDKRIDVIATLINFNGTINDLKNLELCYSPLFGTAKDIVNLSGYLASNFMKNSHSQIPYSEARNLVGNNSFIIDVSSAPVSEKYHLINAINIPFNEIRNRIDEIPKDVPVYLYCKNGQKSYMALGLLENLGYRNAILISGGYTSISFFEYFNDTYLKRKPILTNYYFGK